MPSSVYFSGLYQTGMFVVCIPDDVVQHALDGLTCSIPEVAQVALTLKQFLLTLAHLVSQLRVPLTRLQGFAGSLLVEGDVIYESLDLWEPW